MLAEHTAGGRDMLRLQFAIARAVFPVALCLPLAGCSFVAGMTGGLENPVAELQASKVESISQGSTHLVFALTIRNPNAYALTVQAFQYRLAVNQVVVASGATAVSAKVPSKGSASVDLPIEVRTDRLSAAAQGAMVLGEVPFDLDVWLAVGSWPRRREIHLPASSVLRWNLPLGLARNGAIAFRHLGWQS